MNRVQDPMPEVTGRLRDAFEAAADTVPGTAAPFSVLDAGQARSRRRNRPGIGLGGLDGAELEQRRARRRALTPLAAAVAVVAVVAGSVVTAGLLGGGHSHGTAATWPHAATGGGIPPFVLTWASGSLSQEQPAFDVLSSATGAPLGQIDPPRPGDHVTAVAGVAATRTFVVAVGHEGSCGTQLYEVRLTTTGRLAGYAPLINGSLAGTVYSLAVSPDASTVAFAAENCQVTGAEVGVFGHAGNTMNSWSVPRTELITSLSLSGDGSMLAYVTSPGQGTSAPHTLPLAGEQTSGPDGQIRLLITSSPTGPLASRSRLLVRPSGLRPPGVIGEVSITPDGTGLVFSEDPVHATAHSTTRLWLIGVGGKAVPVAFAFSDSSRLDISAAAGTEILAQYNGPRSALLDRFNLATGKRTLLPSRNLDPGTSPTW